jgi:hypothetical protein
MRQYLYYGTKNLPNVLMNTRKILINPNKMNFHNRRYFLKIIDPVFKTLKNGRKKVLTHNKSKLIQITRKYGLKKLQIKNKLNCLVKDKIKLKFATKM